MYMFYLIRLWRYLTVTGTLCPTTSRSSWRKMGSSLSSTRYHRGWRWSRSTISALSGSNTGTKLFFMWSVTWPCPYFSAIRCWIVLAQITNYKSQWSDVQLSGRVPDDRADRPILRSHQTWRLWWGEAEVWFHLIFVPFLIIVFFLIIVHLQIFALTSRHITCKHRRFTLTFRGLAFEFPAETKFQPSYGGSRRELGRLQFPPG